MKFVCIDGAYFRVEDILYIYPREQLHYKSSIRFRDKSELFFTSTTDEVMNIIKEVL